VLACAAVWRPRVTWASTLREPYEALRAGARGFDATKAWSEVAMLMGDTRGAPLALVVCLHAATELPDGVEDRRLCAHRDLCLLDLGLGHAPGPVKISTLGDPGTVTEQPAQIAAWLAQALVPFDGDLKRAAWYALELAAVRLGISQQPEPQP
jgi:hypothetical protein